MDGNQVGFPYGLSGTGFPASGYSGLPDGHSAITVSGVGLHWVIAYWDFDTNDVLNGFTNESATVHGTPGVGQSWDIAPGFSDFSGNGVFYSNFGNNTLTNSNTLAGHGDVAAALGWTFTLAAGEVATIDFDVLTRAPLSGFYIKHLDDGSADGTSDELFYTSSMNVVNTPVPESSIIVLLITGMGALVCVAPGKLRPR